MRPVIASPMEGDVPGWFCCYFLPVAGLAFAILLVASIHRQLSKSSTCPENETNTDQP